MKYISPNSMVYRRAQAAFQNDGRGLYGYLFNYGHKPYTRRQISQREAVWRDASIENLKIPIDDDTCYTWKEWCMKMGGEMGKNMLQIREKYLDGFRMKSTSGQFVAFSRS